jgi:DNA-binding transcriptional ArsR family regulator
MTTTRRRLSFDKLNNVAKVLKVVSHPVRLEILEILEADEPLTVSEIQERINSPVEQSMLSHHLIKMKDNGILTSYKQGKNSYYQLTDRTMMNIFDCIGICEVF